MRRPDGIRALLDRVGDEPIIANLGSATFDLYHAEQRDANFYTWGAMGMVSSVGLGVALAAPEKKVYVLDGDGSLLDQMTMLYGGGLSDGHRHSSENLPILVVGGGGGRFREGRHVRCSDSTPMSNLHVTLMDTLGLDVERFGTSSGALKLDAVATL